MATVKSIDYGLTVTIKPRHYKLIPETQLDLAVAEFEGKLSGYNCKYSMICEFTRNYNIHFHVIISFQERVKDYIRLLYDLFRDCKFIGFILVKPVDDYVAWTKYMTKDIEATYKKLKCRHPVIRNDYLLDYSLGLTSGSADDDKS